MPLGYRFSATARPSGITLVAAVPLAACLPAGNIHEGRHLGDAGEGDGVVCLIGPGGSYALLSGEVETAPARGDFLPPRFAFTPAFASFLAAVV